MIPTFAELTPIIILVIATIGFVAWYKIRTSYKVVQMKEAGKVKKKSETVEGSIDKMLEDAPKQLQTIKSEIATLKAKGATPDMLKRLESEEKMLEYAVRYGDLAKPFVGTVGKFVTKLTSSLGV